MNNIDLLFWNSEFRRTCANSSSYDKAATHWLQQQRRRSTAL